MNRAGEEATTHVSHVHLRKAGWVVNRTTRVLDLKNTRIGRINGAGLSGARAFWVLRHTLVKSWEVDLVVGKASIRRRVVR